MANASYALTYVVDPSLLDSGVNPVVWQNLKPFATNLDIPATVRLTADKKYLLAMVVLDANYRRLAVSSREFIAN